MPSEKMVDGLLARIAEKREMVLATLQFCHG